jgi:hypothetical protein
MYPFSVVSLLALKWLREAFVPPAADKSIAKDRMDSHTHAQASDAQASSPQGKLGTRQEPVSSTSFTQEALLSLPLEMTTGRIKIV